MGRRQHDDRLTNPRYVVAIHHTPPSPVEAFLLTPFPQQHPPTPEEREEIEEFLHVVITETLSDPRFEEGYVMMRQAWAEDTPISRRRNCRTPGQLERLARTAGRLVIHVLINDSAIEAREWGPAAQEAQR